MHRNENAFRAWCVGEEGEFSVFLDVGNFTYFFLIT